MNKSFRRTLAMLLCAVMLLCCVPIASAQDSEPQTQSVQGSDCVECESVLSENGIMDSQASETLSVTSSLTIDAAAADPRGYITVKVSNRTGNSYGINWNYTFSSGKKAVENIEKIDGYFSGSEVVFVISVTGAMNGTADISFTVTNNTSSTTVGTKWCKVTVTAPTLTVTPSDIVIDLNYTNTATIKAVISNFNSNTTVDIGFGAQSSYLTGAFGNYINNGTEIIITGNTPGTYYFNVGLRNTNTGYTILENAYRVTVKPKVTLSSISVYQKPTKTAYQVGDTFNSNGLKIKANYSDGTYQILSSGFTVSSPNMSTAGNKTVTVTYNGKSTSFTITVNPKPVTLSSISVYQNPTKTVYQVGDTFNSSGLKIKANYSDGTYQILSSGFTVSSPNMSTAGNKTVVVTYGGKSTSFTITVNEKAVENKNAESVEIYLIKDFDGTDTALVGIIINPSDAKVQRITWSSSNSSVATVNASGEIRTYGVNGEAIIAVTVTNMDGTTVSDSVRVTVSDAGTGNDTTPPDNSGSIWDDIINFFMSILDFLILPFKWLFGLF